MGRCVWLVYPIKIEKSQASSATIVFLWVPVFLVSSVGSGGGILLSPSVYLLFVVPERIYVTKQVLFVQLE